VIYLLVDDVQSRIEELRADGVVIESDAQVIFEDTEGIFGPAGTDEWMGFIRDSEDNLVGLVSRHPHVDMVG
jgi:methylmalonyl-CoA/ethylmalonyl-CoA epimerase